MGVGYAEDLVVCVALGVDMFDCVFPTRTAVSFDINHFCKSYYELKNDIVTHFELIAIW